MEHNEKTDLWIDLPSKNSITFWPETNSMQMYVKYRDSKFHSQAFLFSTIHHTVLRMDKGVRTNLFKIQIVYFSIHVFVGCTLR